MHDDFLERSSKARLAPGGRSVEDQMHSFQTACEARMRKELAAERERILQVPNKQTSKQAS